MKHTLCRAGCWLFIPLIVITGCGQQQKPEQQIQSTQQNNKPIDTQLQQQMKMYQEIKQQEFEVEQKKRESEKKQLKKLQETQEKALKHDIEYQKMLRRSGNPWAATKENNSSGNSPQSGNDQGAGGQKKSEDSEITSKAKKLENPLRDKKKSE
ncbi:hypothetical protein SAMN02799630_05833 [Paenibacillus sp. UNCCL117]|uniref:hypothetical protein n=1 Tax=unclassified Paenibacillus TaxID=185978 RepID=UPI00089030E7|nr:MULTISPECIES: hypothetical protein [unclassified Paenibacillus]SDB98645.1 hypothetical protein SAMN04488602_10110 [Paenibacillus sp. cl123]SFW68983.1 hypothetical protein SAMN02799630_05833 [Paenibacillus sp. UNCCL117]